MYASNTFDPNLIIGNKMAQETNITDDTVNAHFGILLNPETVLDIEDLKKENQPDQFGFEKKIPEFVNYVNEYLGNRKSIVAGIYGDYGSGKSIFVNLVKDKIEKKKIKKTKFIVFHAWKYKDEQSIWRNFILNIARKLGISKEKLNDLYNCMYYSEEKKEHDSLVFVSIWIYILFLISIVILAPTEFIAQLVSIISLGFVIWGHYLFKRTRGPMFSIEEFENKFRTSINDCEHDRIYIAIENIDRCLPHQSIRLLESLKAFLECNDDQLEKKLIFLIPCDKNILQLAIEKEYGNSNKLNASTYLDKLIQLPYDLPVCSDKDWKCYVESLLNVSQNKDVSFGGYKKSFVDWIIGIFEYAEITNPREIKILFREWEMRLVNLDKELKYNDSIEKKVLNLSSALILLKLLILKKKFQDVYDCLLHITRVESKLCKEPDDLLEQIFSGSSKHLCTFLRNNLPPEADKEIRRQIIYRLVDDISQNNSNDTKNLDRTKYKAKIISPAFSFLGSSCIRPSSFDDLRKFMLTTKSAKESSKSQDIPKGSVPI